MKGKSITCSTVTQFQCYVSRAFVICDYVKVFSINSGCEFLRNILRQLLPTVYVRTYIHCYACDDVTAIRIWHS